jgi:DNA mismatch repair protein MutL
VRQAIGAHNLTPAIDFDADVNIISKLSNTGSPSKEAYFEERFGTPAGRSNTANWEKVFEGTGQDKRFPGLRDNLPTSNPIPLHTLRFESAMNQEDGVPEEKPCFQLHQRFIVKQVKSGLLFVDQQAAHERILFQKFLQQSHNRSVQSQQSLFPQALTFNAADFAMILEMQQEIEALGFKIEVFGKNTLLINGVPANLSGSPEKDLFEGLIEQFKINQTELSVPLGENLVRALAKRASIKAGQVLVRGEMKALLDSLFACSTPNYAPDGRPTFFILELHKIETYFR